MEDDSATEMEPPDRIGHILPSNSKLRLDGQIGPKRHQLVVKVRQCRVGRLLIAYVHDFRFDAAIRSEIVIINESGAVLHTLPIPRDSEVNAILQIGWRDDRHPFAEGHVNPSTTRYLEWDLSSGHQVDERIGSWFAVSPNGRFIAQHTHIPHGARPPYDSSSLLINGKVVYPRPGDSAYHRFAGHLAWSDDSISLALVDQTAGKTEVVVVDPIDGAVTLIPIAAAFALSELSWSAPNIIAVGSGGEAGASTRSQEARAASRILPSRLSVQPSPRRFETPSVACRRTWKTRAADEGSNLWVARDFEVVL